MTGQDYFICGDYFNDAVSCSDATASNVMINDEVNGFGRKRSRSYSSIGLEGLKKPTKNLKIADVTAEFRTKRLPNTSLERFR
jgi:hypothetical protein